LREPQGCLRSGMVKRTEVRPTGICPNDFRTKEAFELTSSRYPTIHLSKSISANVADDFRRLRRELPFLGEGDHSVDPFTVNRC
jgi:hypothetical protein